MGAFETAAKVAHQVMAGWAVLPLLLSFEGIAHEVGLSAPKFARLPGEPTRQRRGKFDGNGFHKITDMTILAEWQYRNIPFPMCFLRTGRRF